MQLHGHAHIFYEGHAQSQLATHSMSVRMLILQAVREPRFAVMPVRKKTRRVTPEKQVLESVLEFGPHQHILMHCDCSPHSTPHGQDVFRTTCPFLLKALWLPSNATKKNMRVTLPCGSVHWPIPVATFFTRPSPRKSDAPFMCMGPGRILVPNCLTEGRSQMDRSGRG